DADRAQPRLVAQDGDVDAGVARGLPDRLTLARLQRAAVDGELDHVSLRTDSAGPSATWPRPQIDVKRIVSSSSSSAASSARGRRPATTSSRSATAFSLPTRHGTHLPQLSLRKKRVTLAARARRSVPLATTTSAPEPSIEPAACNVPKSIGVLA